MKRDGRLSWGRKMQDPHPHGSAAPERARSCVFGTPFFIFLLLFPSPTCHPRPPFPSPPLRLRLGPAMEVGVHQEVHLHLNRRCNALGAAPAELGINLTLWERRRCRLRPHQHRRNGADCCNASCPVWTLRWVPPPPRGDRAAVDRCVGYYWRCSSASSLTF